MQPPYYVISYWRVPKAVICYDDIKEGKLLETVLSV